MVTAVTTSKLSAIFYQTTQRRHLQIRRRENLKSHQHNGEIYPSICVSWFISVAAYSDGVIQMSKYDLKSTLPMLEITKDSGRIIDAKVFKQWKFTFQEHIPHRTVSKIYFGCARAQQLRKKNQRR